MAEATQWLGLVTDADPHDIPPGAMTAQTNVQCLVPGKLTVRKGVRSCSYAVFAGGSGQVLGLYQYNIPLGKYLVAHTAGNGGQVFLTPESGTSPGAIETGVAADVRSCWVETRKGRLIRVNGVARGSVWNNENLWPLGVAAPAAAPAVVVAAGGAAYDADYLCAFRYVDAAGIPSSLSPALTVSPATNNKFTWTAPYSTSTRITKIQLWRTLADASDVYYLVYEATNGTGNLVYADTLSDATLKTNTSLPTYYDDGALCARRFEVPPYYLAVVCQFQDRYFYAVCPETTAGARIGSNSGISPGVGMSLWEAGKRPLTITIVADAGSGSWTLTLEDGTTRTYSSASTSVYLSGALAYRNSLVYSEVDEPESVPISQNHIICQENTDDNDSIVGLMPHGSVLWVLKNRHVYRFTFATDPRYDGSVTLAFCRGAFNNVCWKFLGDTAYLMDEFGAWSFGPEGMRPISAPVQNYWRDGSIDFTKSKWFFVSVEPSLKIVRFHVLLTTDSASTYPTRALCYSPATGAWWWETYTVQLADSCMVQISGRRRTAVAAPAISVLVMDDGLNDKLSVGASNTAISWDCTTGLYSIPADSGPDKERDRNAKPSKEVVLCFPPTTGTETIAMQLYWDHTATAVTPSGVGGEGGISYGPDSSSITVSIKAAQSPLGTAPGYERWPLKVGASTRAVTHRYLAIKLSGAQSAEAIGVYSLDVKGVD